MSQPYIGEIRIFAGNFAPVGWAFCNGQLIPISENDALFNLIGTTYGGDGQTTFALPDLRGRAPVHVGPGFALGQTGGAEQVMLTTQQIPAHSHVPLADGAPASATAAGAVFATQPTNAFAAPPATANMAAGAIGSSGGSQPHDNMPPYIVTNYIISLFGIFPSQT